MSRYSFNQVDLVLDHLKRKGYITTWEAFELYGITRLSAKIHILRKENYKITSVSTTRKNRYGHICTYSTYTLDANNDKRSMEVY